MGESTNQRRGKMAPKRIPRGCRRSGFLEFGLNASVPLEIGFTVRAFGLFLALRINFEMPEGTNFFKKHKSESWKSMVWVIGAIFPASSETGRKRKMTLSEASPLYPVPRRFKGEFGKGDKHTEPGICVYISETIWPLGKPFPRPPCLALLFGIPLPVYYAFFFFLPYFVNKAYSPDFFSPIKVKPREKKRKKLKK